MTQCVATTARGHRCKNFSNRGELCALHLAMRSTKVSFWARHQDTIKGIGAVATAAGALIELIHKIITTFWPSPLSGYEVKQKGDRPGQPLAGPIPDGSARTKLRNLEAQALELHALCNQ